MIAEHKRGKTGGERMKQTDGKNRYPAGIGRFMGVMLVCLSCTVCQVQAETDTASQSSEYTSEETQYTYDANNRLTGIRYPDGSKICYTYDADGNLISVRYQQAQSEASEEGSTKEQSSEEASSEKMVSEEETKATKRQEEAVRQNTETAVWNAEESASLIVRNETGDTSAIVTYDGVEPQSITDRSDVNSDSQKKESSEQSGRKLWQIVGITGTTAVLCMTVYHIRGYQRLKNKKEGENKR